MMADIVLDWWRFVMLHNLLIGRGRFLRGVIVHRIAWWLRLHVSYGYTV
jgi:hypothetical protein